jgi:uncharacterized protein (DUF305 family)
MRRRLVLTLAVLVLLGGCTDEEPAGHEGHDAGGSSAPAASSEVMPRSADRSTSTAPVLQPGGPGDANATVTGPVTVATPTANDIDVAFARDMVVHHAQAVEMVDLAEDELTGQVRGMALRIRDAQRPEIATLAMWLHQHGYPVPRQAQDAGVDLAELGVEPADEHNHHDHADMAGMASPEELGRLGAAQGEEAQQQFLELMIAHHEGALEMAQTQADGGSDPVVTELAHEIYSGQQVEIQRMQELLP